MKKLKDELGVEFLEKTERIMATTPQSVGGIKKINNV